MVSPSILPSLMSVGEVGRPSIVPVTPASLAVRCSTTGTLLPSKSNAPFQSPLRLAGQASAARKRNRAVTVHARFIAESLQVDIVTTGPAPLATPVFRLGEHT